MVYIHHHLAHLKGSHGNEVIKETYYTRLCYHSPGFIWLEDIIIHIYVLLYGACFAVISPVSAPVNKYVLLASVINNVQCNVYDNIKNNYNKAGVYDRKGDDSDDSDHDDDNGDDDNADGNTCLEIMNIK